MFELIRALHEQVHDDENRGGLLSRETIRAVDELLAAARQLQEKLRALDNNAKST